MDDEWDLHAVVRSCTAAAGTTTSTVHDCDDGLCDFESVASENDSNPFSNSTSGENPPEGLEEVYREGCVQRLLTTGAGAVSVDGGGFVHEELSISNDSHLFSIETPGRKRKNQHKKTVVQMKQEELCNDIWAWRKYGQKPIKGSPFPRNYYRCSTTKACGARKQVEQSPMDPTVFIVTYTGEHMHPRPTHRSPLAGSSRSNKFSTDKHPPCSSSSP